MKLLFAAAIVLSINNICNINDLGTHKSYYGDTTKWRLISLELKDISGSFSQSMNFSDRQSMLYLQFINNVQVVSYTSFNNFKPDTGTYKRSRDTLFISRFRLSKIAGNDTFLVKKQNPDSLVLLQISFTGTGHLRFDNRKFIKQAVQLSTDFYKNATKWKLIISETHSTYKNGESTSRINMLDSSNAKNEVFLFLNKDTAVGTSIIIGIRDTTYYKLQQNMLYSLRQNPDTSFIVTKSKDSLIITGKKFRSERIVTSTSHYASHQTIE